MNAAIRGAWAALVAVLALTLGEATAAADDVPAWPQTGPTITVGDVRTAYVLNHHGEVNWPRGVRFEVDR